MTTANDIKDLLLANDNFTIYTHPTPDGDALGSSFALQLTLNSLGKKAAVVLEEIVASPYRLLKGDFVLPSVAESGFVITIDCGDKRRIGGYSENAGEIVINIDHHKTNEYFAKYNFVDENAAATGELIFRIIKSLDIPLNKDIAENLFAAIATDTGSFRYPNTTADTHMIAAELYNAGIDGAALNKALFNTKTLRKLRVTANCIENTEFFENGKIAVYCMTQQFYDEMGCDESDVDGLSSLLSTIEGVVLGAFIREKSEKEIKIGLRSYGNVNVATISKSMGGGGHVNSSGLIYNDTLVNCKSILLPKLIEEVKRSTIGA